MQDTRDLGGQPGLARTGFAADQQDLAGALHDALPHALQDPELVAAAHEPRPARGDEPGWQGDRAPRRHDQHGSSPRADAARGPPLRLGVLEGVWEGVRAGRRPGPADRRRTRRGQDPAGRRGPRVSGEQHAGGGHGVQGRRGCLPAVRRDAGPPVPHQRGREQVGGRRRGGGSCRHAVRHLRTAPRPPGTRPVRGGGGAVPVDRPRPAAGPWASTTCTQRTRDRRAAGARGPLLPGQPRPRARARCGPPRQDRSDELSARLADLHRLDSVRRLDLAGLRHDAIAEFVGERAAVSPAAARRSAAMLHEPDRHDLISPRETWLDLERHGGAPCAARNGCRSPSATRWPPGWPARRAGAGDPSSWPRCSATASTCRRSPGRRGGPQPEHGRATRGRRGRDRTGRRRQR